MISDLAILNLQVFASVLMGYDYFLSDALKEHANVAARDYVKAQQDFLDKKLRAQTSTFFTVLPVLLSGAVFAILSWGSLSLMHMIGSATNNAWGVLALAVLAIFFFVRAMKRLMDGFTQGILPFTFPVIFRLATSFLLFSSKGAIAALGLLFLAASFACRYFNLLHHP